MIEEFKFKSANYMYEIGPIRPPSESQSLLLRIVRNCPWNRCKFCPVYKSFKFSPRNEKELIEELEKIKTISEEVSEFFDFLKQKKVDVKSGILYILGNSNFSDCFKQVALWVYRGKKSIFLQDADPLVLKTEILLKVLEKIRRDIGKSSRITAYSRSSTTFKLGAKKLADLKKAGLDRVHTGLESGSEKILKFMRKGVTPDQQIKGGLNVREAGLELSLYIMPGLGGRDLSKEHAIETANVINAIEPDFIRLRTLAIPENIPLYEDLITGKFIPLGEDEVIKEIKLFIENLRVSRGRLESDHILNLLEDLKGDLPEEKDRLLLLIDKYLSLPDEDRTLFSIGRRAGIFRTINDLNDLKRRKMAKDLLNNFKKDGIDLEIARRELMTYFI